MTDDEVEMAIFIDGYIMCTHERIKDGLKYLS